MEPAGSASTARNIGLFWEKFRNKELVKQTVGIYERQDRGRNDVGDVVSTPSGGKESRRKI